MELNFSSCKWFLLGTYHPPCQSDQHFLENVNKALGKYDHYYYDHYLENFLYQHNVKSLIKKTPFLKSISNPSCIDLFLTNNALSFQSTKTVSTGLSAFHKLVLTVLKTSIVKNKRREM